MRCYRRLLPRTVSRTRAVQHHGTRQQEGPAGAEPAVADTEGLRKRGGQRKVRKDSHLSVRDVGTEGHYALGVCIGRLSPRAATPNG